MDLRIDLLCHIELLPVSFSFQLQCEIEKLLDLKQDMVLSDPCNQLHLMEKKACCYITLFLCVKATIVDQFNLFTFHLKGLSDYFSLLTI